MNERAIGWDIHRKFSMVSVREITPEGEVVVVERRRLEHADRAAMHSFLSTQHPQTPVAMEGAFGWPWIADLVEACGLDPHLGHPPALRVLAKHQAKSDRRDADRLGEFYLLGIFPESYLAPPEVRQLRERIRHRMALSHLRQILKNRMHALLHRLGILHDFSDVFGVEGRQFLDALELPAASRAVLSSDCRLLDAVTEHMQEIEQWMTQNLEEDETVRLLQSIPGIGLILAHVLKAEIGEIERFPSRRHLCGYVGLAPISDDSADRHGPRHCSVACNHTLRWALIEAAGVVVNRVRHKAPRLFKLYLRLSHGGQSDKNSAKVAVARELAEIVHLVWKKQQPYSADPPPRSGSVPVTRYRRKQGNNKRSRSRCAG